MHEVRFALRYLRRNLLFSVGAAVSLALGMTATTAIYSVVYAVVLDPFPYKDVDNLMSVRVWSPGQNGYRTGYSTDQFLEIAERNTIFDGTIASTISDVLWTDGPEPLRLRGNYGSPITFQVMGVPPLVGRTFGPADVAAGAGPVAVLGYRFWQRQFAGDPGVVGRSLRLNGQMRTVVGVMPKRFMWRGADVYLPIVLRRGEVVEGVRGVHLLGRLKPNVSEAQAAADLGPIIEDLKKREPAQFPDTWRVGLLSFKETFPSSIRQNLWILFGAVGLLLLIACANVSNLLLSKAAARQREMTVRAALGAGRAGIIRQLMFESLFVAIGAGVLGLVLAAMGLQAILALVPPGTIPDESEITLNAPVLLFSFLVSLVTTMIFGLAPALHAASYDIAGTLRAAGRGTTGGRGHVWLRQTLVVVEVALSLMLLVGAGLMIRTILAVRGADAGVNVDRLLTLRVPLPEARYPDRERRVAFFQDLTHRLGLVPGVEAVGLNLGAHPFGGFNAPVEVPGADPVLGPAAIHPVNAGYRTAMGIEVVTGRFFEDTDVERVAPLAVVNQAFVRARFAGRTPLGQFVRVARLTTPPFSSAIDRFEIVGVVRDVANRGIGQDIAPEVYVPYTLAARSDRVMVLARRDPAAIAKAVTTQVYAIDPEQPVTEVRTLVNAMDEFAYAEPRFNLVLFSVFAVLGLVLSVVGVYGVMSSAVAQQVHEVGVRLAIGASPGSVFAMVVGRGARLVAVGIAIGLVGSVFAAKLMAGFVWHASTFDAWTFGIVSVVLLIAALQACIWPARRAARISPVVALREG